MPFKPRTVPSVSLAEGDESAKLRAQLGRQEGKIRELQKVIGEIATLEARKDELNAKLRKLEEVRRAAATPAP